MESRRAKVILAIWKHDKRHNRSHGEHDGKLNKQRLEAFTDGVYAIVITLLILDIRIPDVAAAGLGPALVRMLPQVLTYVLSFFVVGLYWVANHRVALNVR